MRVSLALRLSGAFVAGILFFVAALLSGHGFKIGLLAYSFGGSAALMVLTGLGLAYEFWCERSLAPAASPSHSTPALGRDEPVVGGPERCPASSPPAG